MHTKRFIIFLKIWSNSVWVQFHVYPKFALNGSCQKWMIVLYITSFDQCYNIIRCFKGAYWIIHWFLFHYQILQLSNIRLFSFASYKINSCRSYSLLKAIAKRKGKIIALSRSVAIVGRAITVWEAIQKRSHKPIYKTYTKDN